MQNLFSLDCRLSKLFFQLCTVFRSQFTKIQTWKTKWIHQEYTIFQTPFWISLCKPLFCKTLLLDFKLSNTENSFVSLFLSLEIWHTINPTLFCPHHTNPAEICSTLSNDYHNRISHPTFLLKQGFSLIGYWFSLAGYL